MNQEKITELFKDQEFVKTLLKADSAEEARKLFASRECEVSTEELDFIANTIALVIKKGSKLSDEELFIAGGRREPGVYYTDERDAPHFRKGAWIGDVTGAVVDLIGGGLVAASSDQGAAGMAGITAIGVGRGAAAGTIAGMVGGWITDYKNPSLVKYR